MLFHRTIGVLRWNFGVMTMLMPMMQGAGQRHPLLLREIRYGGSEGFRAIRLHLVMHALNLGAFIQECITIERRRNEDGVQAVMQAVELLLQVLVVLLRRTYRGNQPLFASAVVTARRSYR